MTIRRFAGHASLLVLLVLLGACGLFGPESVQLRELAIHAEDYDGTTVETVGLVREFGAAGEEDDDGDDGDVVHHFVIEDADQNRVEVLPPEAAEPFVGQPVRIVGEFDFDPNRGRAIHVEEITLAAG